MKHYTGNSDWLNKVRPYFSFNRNSILTFTAGIIVVAALVHTPWLNQLERASGLNWLYHWRGAITPPTEIVIVKIDQQTADNLDYPQHLIRWSRETYATLVNQLNLAGANTLVFDIAFIESRPEQDMALAKALQQHGKVILFNYLKRKQTILPNNAVIDIEQQLPPPKLLREAALGYASFTLPKFPAHVNSAELWREHDGTLAITQPLLALFAYYYEYIPQLAEIARQAKGPQQLHQTPPLHGIKDYVVQFRQRLQQNKNFQQRVHRRIIDKHTPLPVKHLFHALTLNTHHNINFYGPPSTLKTIAIDRVLQQPEKYMPLFANKIIYIGLVESAQTEQLDAYRTVYTQPTGLDLSGVEISATVLANLLQDNTIKPAATWLQMFILIASCFFATLVLLILSLRIGGAVLILSLSCYFAFAITLFSQYYLWLPLASPIIAAIAGATLALYVKLVLHRRRQQNVQTALAKYLPQDIADKLSENVNALELQHQLVQGVCLMTDIHGYTSVSEQLSPTELHDRLNRYYSKLIAIVNKHSGAVANIVGDSLLAVWTTDKLDASLCDTALNAAKEMIDTLQQSAQSKDSFPTSIALHCGEFSLGHLGAGNHFEYSPVGDIVNTTSRIEQLNRKLNTQILCSAPFIAIYGKKNMRFKGEFEFKNKQKPLAIYEYNNL